MTTAARDTEVGPLLRRWRERRRISQLELALRADSSARHISFIETGRSRPSEEMVLRLAEHLDVPVRERNALLVVAGYAPRYRETPLEDPSMDALREGMERLLQGYDPFPALVVDGTYTVVAANRGSSLLLAGVAGHLLAPPLNAMRITLHPEGLAPRILNLPEWRADLLAQMERQIALARSPRLRALYEEVAAYPPPERAAGGPRPGERGMGGPGGRPAQDGPAPFALTLRIAHEGRVLSFVASITTFNTPMDVTVAELAIETFLPADRETGEYLRSLSL
ncbi:helix-turn-helix domain-containing protein [Streptomyces sp. NBC_00654]|uniref:MmyB family transcriptional regulator n=1 Tax=Streptomyces sp. NBC_00654 TaxID=2975799 RepID=UPI002253A66D|nr:helix-turn-helix domain-containing protein [Streptomyces sp. NBC_00654]MCX4965847.1 helix-turn-helix domain-containing protein [Streptomyces sp. NBC_00654]